MHRLMVTSATYCQSATVERDRPEHSLGLSKDKENRLLWHARRQRLEGEAIRDTMLALSGEMNLRMFGPSAKPALPAGISSYAWKADVKLQEQQRRSIYVLAKRNLRYPLFDAFDMPDLHNSCARRSQTTTAPQALLLLNSNFTLERAQQWRRRLPKEERALVTQAYREAWGRPANEEEIALGMRFLQDQRTILTARGSDARIAAENAAVDFCHALMNSNEFLYAD